MSEIAEIKQLIQEDAEATKALREKVADIEKNYDGIRNDEIKGLESKLTEITDQRQKAEETLTKLNERLDEMETKSNRPGTGQASPEVVEHKAAFEKFMRKGDEEGLEELQQKAMSIGSDPDGGFAVPEELDREIHKLLVEISPVRSVARVITVGGENYKKLVNTGGTASGWVGETAGRPETNTSQLVELTPNMGEIYANPAATQRSLDDVFFSVEQFLAEEVQEEFAKQEGSAFISGDGVNKPKGFLDYTTATTDDGTRAFGEIQAVNTGTAGGFDATNPGDVFIDTIYKLKAGHRQQAVWMVNSAVTAQIRKFKDGDGNYLWQDNFVAGQPATIAGYSVVTAEDMPAVATDATPIALANWRAAYYIVDRMGTRILRDPYTNKPYVHFYTTKRVGGMLVDSEAIKVIALSA